MSNSQLEERQEREFSAAVAKSLGISTNDLDKVEWTCDDDTSDDGLVYEHIINFEQGSDQAVLDKIAGLFDNRWVKIGPISMRRGDDD